MASRSFSPPPSIGQTFPPAGDVWALAFSPEGKPIGKLSKALYDKGTKELDGKPVRYIASMSSSAQRPQPEPLPMLKVHISLEYPAAAPGGEAPANSISTPAFHDLSATQHPRILARSN